MPPRHVGVKKKRDEEGQTPPRHVGVPTCAPTPVEGTEHENTPNWARFRVQQVWWDITHKGRALNTKKHAQTARFFVFGVSEWVWGVRRRTRKHAQRWVPFRVQRVWWDTTHEESAPNTKKRAVWARFFVFSGAGGGLETERHRLVSK